MLDNVPQCSYSYSLDELVLFDDSKQDLRNI